MGLKRDSEFQFLISFSILIRKFYQLMELFANVQFFTGSARFLGGIVDPLMMIFVISTSTRM